MVNNAHTEVVRIFRDTKTVKSSYAILSGEGSSASFRTPSRVKVCFQELWATWEKVSSSRKMSATSETRNQRLKTKSNTECTPIYRD